MDFFSILDFIRPAEDASPKQKMRWCWNVALTLLMLVGTCIWLAANKASAGDVDKQIKEQLEPIQKKLGEFDAKLNTTNGQLDKIATSQRMAQRADLQTKIINYQEKFCKAPSIEAANTWRTLKLEAQNMCTDLFGENSPACNPPSCSEIK